MLNSSDQNGQLTSHWVLKGIKYDICCRVVIFVIYLFLSLLLLQNTMIFSGLTTQICYLTVLEGRYLTGVPLGKNQGVDRVVLPSGDTREVSTSLISPASRVTHIPWL